MKFGTINRPLTIFCLSASIVMHAGLLWFLYDNPFYFAKKEAIAVMKPAPSPTLLPRDEQELLVDKMERALEESLNEVIAIAHHSELFQYLAKKGEENEKTNIERIHANENSLAAIPKISEEELNMLEYSENKYSATMPPLFDPENEASLAEFALDDEIDELPFCFEVEAVASLDFSNSPLKNTTISAPLAIEDDYSMTSEQFSPTALPLHQSQELSTHFIASLEQLKTPQPTASEEMSEEKMFTQLEESTTPRLILPNSVDYLRTKWVKRSLAERSLPTLDFYGLEEIASSLSWEEEIDIDVALMPSPDSEKYIFSLTLHPEFDHSSMTMQQNFYFLIDRSSSIGKQKFNRFKRAVQRSMAALREGDSFNIIIFDKKVSRLSTKCLAVTPKTVQLAEDFLEREVSKTHFAAGDLYTSLDQLLPERFDDAAMHSVILITDGNTLLSTKKQQQNLATWAKKYEGKVNFYCSAAGKGNNLVLLDLLSYTTGGKLLYSDTNAAFPRKLVRLVKNLHHPIVKNVVVDIATKDTGAKVTLFPSSKPFSPMFAGQAYTIMGTIDELCDFTLFVQGQNNEHWLNIRKNISLKEATRNSRSLEKHWANAQSKICYDQFLISGKRSHLKEAQQIVAPFRGAISMEQ
ncbi:MAG: hypothetical protein KR126chlam1_01113 [Chlamydiae bacterium]|nr:hypothetical protein [Chlamydiota bacterium]